MENGGMAQAQIAFSPPTFDDMSMGSPKSAPICFDN
jgi:hypothetical protein